MEVTKLNPIIFIPGLMGSIGGEMLGCQIEWGFGVASWFYNPFLKELEKLGYKLNENLFVCYYDWRKSCEDIVKEFLQPLILRVEEKHPNQKVDLLCHSMGGVVARTYVQSIEYSYNVRNLMCFGTPNKGNIEAYYLWSTGKVMKRADAKKDLFDIIRRGYIWLLTKILDIPLGTENIGKLHENFEGLGNLIPTYDYGNILCYKIDKDYEYIPREYTLYNNYLLNELNRNIDTLNNRVGNVYCFVGTNKETDKVLLLDTELLFKYKKAYIIGSLKTKEGDGTVTVNSATIDNAKTFITEGSHSGILLGSIGYIADIYNLDRSLFNKGLIEPKEYPLGIILKKYINIELKNERDIIGKFIDGKFITEYEHICQEFGKDYLWIMLRHVPSGEYVLETSGQNKEDHNIFVIGSMIEEELTEKTVQKKETGRMYFSFKV